MTEKKEAKEGKADAQKHPTAPSRAQGHKGTEKLMCSTCGVSVESEKVWVAFKCPACKKELITRCEKCKRLENSYKCNSCGFTGP